MKKILLVLSAVLLMGASCSTLVQQDKDNANSNINEVPVNKKVNSAYCFSNSLAKCVDKQTKVTGIFNKDNLMLTNVVWGEEALSNLKLTQSEYTKENTYGEITDGMKITVKGNIVKLDNNDYAISSSILFVDRHPDTLKCDSSFECYVKDIDCSTNNCGGPGGNSETRCITGECGCECVYRTNF